MSFVKIAGKNIKITEKISSDRDFFCSMLSCPSFIPQSPYRVVLEDKSYLDLYITLIDKKDTIKKEFDFNAYGVINQTTKCENISGTMYF